MMDFARPTFTVTKSDSSQYNSVVCVMKIENVGGVDGFTRAVLHPLKLHWNAEVTSGRLTFAQIIGIKDLADDWGLGSTPKDVCVAFLGALPRKQFLSNIRQFFEESLLRFQNMVRREMNDRNIELKWIECFRQRLSPLTVRGKDVLEREFDAIEAQIKAGDAARQLRPDAEEKEVRALMYSLILEPGVQSQCAIRDVCRDVSSPRVQPQETAEQHEEFYGLLYDLSLNMLPMKSNSFKGLLAFSPQKFRLEEQVKIIASEWLEPRSPTAADLPLVLELAKKLEELDWIPHNSSRQKAIDRARAVLKSLSGIDADTAMVRAMKPQVDRVLQGATNRCLQCGVFKANPREDSSNGFDGKRFCSHQCHLGYESVQECCKCGGTVSAMDKSIEKCRFDGHMNPFANPWECAKCKGDMVPRGGVRVAGAFRISTLNSIRSTPY